MSVQWAHHLAFFDEYGEGAFPCAVCKTVVRLYWGNNHYRNMRNRAVIHHIDGDHSNNDIENLAVMHYGCHSRLHQTGRRASEATRRKLSESHQGFKHSAESNAKRSIALKGKPWTKTRRQAQK